MASERERNMTAALARAQAAVDGLSVDYVALGLADVKQCLTLLDAVRARSRAERSFAGIFDIAHNIKGQGSSFGFPLVTRIGDSLCRLTRFPRVLTEADLATVQAHLDALAMVLNHGIKGEGGPLGQKLAERLEAMAKQAMG